MNQNAGTPSATNGKGSAAVPVKAEHDKLLKDAVKWKLKELSNGEIEELVVYMWSLQEADEQLEGESKKRNAIGLNKLDAELFADFIKTLDKGDHISREQVKSARNKLVKYWRQLRDPLGGEAALLEEYAEAEAKKQQKRKAYFEKDGQLYLEILTTDEKYQFAYHKDNGDVGLIDSMGDISPVSLPKTKQGDLAVIVKLPDERIATTALLAPLELLEKIKSHIKKYCDLSKRNIELCCYYILFSWFHRKTNTVGYLRFKSDTGKGKSRMLTVVGHLCFYPILASGSSSFSGTMRIKENWHGTLVIDEADIAGDKEHQLVKYLNLGFEADKYFILSDKKNPQIQEVFDPFGPKIIAMREPFRDNATEGRLLSISPHETTNDAIPVLLRQQYDAETAELRNEIARFVLAHWNEIDGERLVSFEGMNIERRLQQLAMPLSIIFQLWPDGTAEFTAYIQSRQDDLRRERSMSWHGSMFNMVYALASGDEEIQAVTPSMVAEHMKHMKTSTKTVTQTLRSIGFEVESRYITDTVSEGNEPPTTKQKRVRAYVIPNAQVWREIVQRYYYDETGTDGTDGTVKLHTLQTKINDADGTDGTHYLTNNDFLSLPNCLRSRKYTQDTPPVFSRVPSVPCVPQADGANQTRTDGTGEECTIKIDGEQHQKQTVTCPCGASFTNSADFGQHAAFCDTFQRLQTQEAVERMRLEEAKQLESEANEEAEGGAKHERG